MEMAEPPRFCDPCDLKQNMIYSFVDLSAKFSTSQSTMRKNLIVEIGIEKESHVPV